MRQIETALLAAIAASTLFKQGNTTYDPRSQTVRLHGNPIAVRHPMGGWHFNLCGWNTPTTRSRLNALGAGVSCKAGLPMVSGRAVPENGQWWSAP